MKYLVLASFLILGACKTVTPVPELQRLDVPPELMKPMPTELKTVEPRG